MFLSYPDGSRCKTNAFCFSLIPMAHIVKPIVFSHVPMDHTVKPMDPNPSIDTENVNNSMFLIGLTYGLWKGFEQAILSANLNASETV